MTITLLYLFISAASYRGRLYIGPLKKSIILNDGRDSSDNESEKSSNDSENADIMNETIHNHHSEQFDSQRANSSNNHRIIQKSNTNETISITTTTSNNIHYNEQGNILITYFI